MLELGQIQCYFAIGIESILIPIRHFQPIMSFTITRKTDYALVALTALAREQLGARGPASARLLAQRYGLPIQLLMNILKELHRSGIIDSRRGANGGYFLSREPAALSLREVVESMEGPVNVTLCSDTLEEHDDGEAVACRIATRCPIVSPMQKVNLLFREFLSGITLKSLIEDESAIQIPPVGVRV